MESNRRVEARASKKRGVYKFLSGLGSSRDVRGEPFFIAQKNFLAVKFFLIFSLVLIWP